MQEVSLAMKRFYLNNNWKYQKGFDKAYLNAYQEDFEDIRIPHTVAIDRKSVV